MRPPTRLLAKPKSGTFQALEAAASAKAAYEDMGSDSEEDFDYGEALSKLCPPSGPQQPEPQPAQSSGQGALATSPSNPEAMCSDSETSSSSSREAGCRLSWLQRKPRSPAAGKTRLRGELDVNFNPQAASGETSDSSDPEGVPPTTDHRARRWRRARGGPEEPGRGPSSAGDHTQAHRTPQVTLTCKHTHALTPGRAFLHRVP